MSKVFGIVSEIPIEQIKYDLDARGRSDYGDIKQLSISIARHGLIHPIAVYSSTNTPPYELVAGCRRLLACKELKLLNIACRIYDHALSSYELKAIELFENVDRKDMSEVEKAKMISQLHDLMVAINGPKITHTPDASGHSMRDTAKMLGKSVSSVSKDIQLAKATEDFPELLLEQVGNKTTAMNMLRRFQSALLNRQSAQAADIDKDHPNQHLLRAYILGDFFDNTLTSNTYSFIECDPPYGIDLHTMRAAADKQTLNSEYIEIDPLKYFKFLSKLAIKTYHLAAPQSWMIFWYGPQWYQYVKEALNSAGWKVNPIPGIWKKGNTSGQAQSPSTTLGNSYETFLYACKGSPKLRELGRSNIFDFSGVHPLHRIHPTERPKELILELMRVFTWAGANVLVPFAGSGNTLIAANMLGMQGVGFDLSEEFRNAYVQRVMNDISEVDAQLEL